VYPPLVSLWGQQISTEMELASDESTNNTVSDADALAFSSTAGFTDQAWSNFYLTIFRTNLVTDRVPSINMPTARRDQIIGEAKFIRAMSYFYLVRLYGAVPVFTSEAATNGTAARTPVDSVYAQVVKDATDAAAALPTTWTGTNLGRPTKGSALALLADVSLTRRDWTNAEKYASQVIGLGVYSLQNNYLAAFLPASQNGPENVFSLQVNGLTEATGSRYVYHYYPRTLAIGAGGGWSDAEVSPLFAASYLPGDYRKDVSIITTQRDAKGVAQPIPPHMAKFRPSNTTSINNGDVNYFVYRYAEVLLIEAEALNELGRTADAVTYMNQIRARARRGTGAENRTSPANYTGPLTQAAVREAILQERGWELAFEGKRWFDLVRQGPDYFMAKLKLDPGATQLTANKMLLPIPSQELQLDRNLTQNPGY
jgi:hypothetical protein